VGGQGRMVSPEKLTLKMIGTFSGLTLGQLNKFSTLKLA